MSESLLCFQYLQLHDRSSTSPILLKEFSVSSIVQYLSSNNTNMNIFAKHGYPAYHLNSHSIRHYLNNMAFTAGVSLDVITLWSSRASIEQTLTYVDHDSILKAKTKDFTLNSENVTRNYLPAIEESSLQTLTGPFQKTLYGVCLRSWKTAPCNKVFDCLNCSEILICKRDKAAKNTISQERESLQATFDNAQAAIAQGERAAQMWTSRMAPYLEKLTQLENVFNDDSVSEDAMIQISNCNNFSHEQSILDEKLKDAGLEMYRSSKYGTQLTEEALIEIKRLTGGEN